MIGDKGVRWWETKWSMKNFILHTIPVLIPAEDNKT